MMHAAVGGGRSLLIEGRWEAADETMAVVDPWTGRPIDAVACADVGHVERAVASALRGAEAMRLLSTGERGRILHAAATALEGDAGRFAAAITSETGKPIRSARHEVARAVNTLRLSAEEAVRLAGETIARKILRDETFAKARPVLAAQCGAALARIHATPAEGLPDLPFSGAREQLDRYEEVYRSFDTPRPIFDLAFRHLRDSAPAAHAPTLVHGDFRLGNIMVGPEGLVAALDWEITHIGDPTEDLSWVCMPSWRFGQMDKPVGGFGEVTDLLKGYREAGGDPRIDEAAVRWWTMFGSLKWGCMCLTMFRAYDSGADPSVERAAIGRRASETELDLMLMLTGKL